MESPKTARVFAFDVSMGALVTGGKLTALGADAVSPFREPLCGLFGEVG